MFEPSSPSPSLSPSLSLAVIPETNGEQPITHQAPTLPDLTHVPSAQTTTQSQTAQPSVQAEALMVAPISEGPPSSSCFSFHLNCFSLKISLSLDLLDLLKSLGSFGSLGSWSPGSSPSSPSSGCSRLSENNSIIPFFPISPLCTLQDREDPRELRCSSLFTFRFVKGP